MDVSSQFDSVSITGTRQFSWVFIVDWILALVLTIFVIFYFNRLIGTVLSTIFRWYLWHRHRIRVKVQSLQLSLLGGRIFFKNFTYVGSNEIICALQGNITWRYWLHRRRLSKLETDQTEAGHVLSGDDVPTRLGIQVDGLEWFVFNRSAAYDGLYDYFMSHQQQQQQPNGSSDMGSSQNTEFASSPGGGAAGGDSLNKEVNHMSVDSSGKNDGSASFSVFDNMFLRLMPVQLRCNKGSVVVGNRNTPSLLVLHFASGTSSIDVGPSKNKLDKYKMIYHTHLTRPILEMRPNIDYEGPNAVERLKRAKPKKQGLSQKIWSRFSRTTVQFLDRLLLGKIRERQKNEDAPEDGLEWEKMQWKGLSRYLTRDNEENRNINTTSSSDDSELADEYGKYSTLVDAPDISMTYYYDIPGVVPFNVEDTPSNEGPDVGNSGSSPEFGATLTLNESTIHYGPWADRQRVPLQSMLLPRYCCDATPAQRRIPGQDRIYTGFKLQVDFTGDNIIRLPTREFSKNAQFIEQYKENPTAHSLRPFGWFELKFKDCSSILFNAQMMATKYGSRNNFHMDFKYPELRSSVNHGLLFSAKSHHLSGQTRYPLSWNGLQNWKVDNSSFNAKTFFLREHVTLLTDLLKDFSSGPPVKYELFTPVRYDINWTISNYAIYLNVNDLNIINNPSDFEDNTFVSLQGERLDIGIAIPLEQIYQNKTRINFNINVSLGIFVWQKKQKSLFNPKFD
jgi:hypothetical protein